MLNKLQYSLMLFFAATIPVISLYAPLAMAPIFFILAVCPLIIFIKQGAIKNIWKDSALNKVIIIFLIYALASSLWAIKPSESFNLWARMLLMFISALALFSYAPQLENKEKLLKTLLWGTIGALVIANIELLTDGNIIKNIYLYAGKKPLNDYVVLMNRGASVISIFSWAIICYLCASRNFKTAVLLFLVTALTIFRMESLSTFLGFVIGGVVIYPLIFFTGKNILRVFAVLAVIGVFAGATAASLLDAHKAVGNVPVIPGAASDNRLYIYDYASKQALKKPIFGWGFNASRSYPVDKADYVQNGRSPLPLHPHNNTLQVWLELGAVGLVIFASFLALLLLRISNLKYSPYIVAASGALFGNFFLIGQIGYGIWQNWWVSSAILAVTFLLVARDIKQKPIN